MTEAERLRLRVQMLRGLAQQMSLEADRAYFANLADRYEREAAQLEAGPTQQIGTQPPLPPSNSQPQVVQQQQQLQPDKDESK
jgi:hypothetical protein